MVVYQNDANEVDLAVGGISETPTQYEANTRDGRFTITEAAQIKGVSYHTVSRAIRRGRLPVQRLGRMALIAEEDLVSWRPMREKAPRKYRQPDPALESPISQLDVHQGEPLDLATRLSSFYEDIHLAASESSLAEFVTLVCARFAEALGLSRVGFWMIDEAGNLAQRVGAFGDEFNPFPNVFALDAIPFVLTFGKVGQSRIVLDLKAELTDWSNEQDTGGIDMLLIAPLRLRSRAVGIVCGDRGGQEIDLTQEQLALAHRLANQIALAFESNRSLRAEARHTLQLTTVMEEVDAAICACDAQGRMTILNATHRILAGYSDEESDDIIGMNARDYLAQNSGRRFHVDGTPFLLHEHPLIRAINGETVHEIEYQIMHDGRDPVYVVASGTPIMINGEFLGAVSTAREISRERRHIDRGIQAVTEAEQRLARAQVLASTTAALLDARTVADVHDIALNVLRDQLQANFSSIYHKERGGKLRLMARLGFPMPVDGDDVYDVIAFPNTATALASGYPSTLRREATLLLESRNQSDSETVTSMIVPLQHHHETVGVMYANFREVREHTAEEFDFAHRLSGAVASALVRVRDQAEVAASQERLLAVVDQLPQAMLIVSYPAGEVLIANRAAESMWGTPLRDPSFRAENLSVIDIEGRHSNRDNHPLLRSLQTGVDYLGEPLTVERSDGTLIEVLANHTPVFDLNGLILGSVSVLQDRANFKPLDRAKDEFLSVVAHEIRNPLTALRGNLQLLDRRIRRGSRDDIDSEVKRIGTVIEQVDRIAELVSRMLDISRADLGKLDIAVAETDASALVQSVVNEVSGTDPLRDVRVTAPERLPVVWDEMRIQQVLTNLLTNAMRYAPEGPIEINLSNKDSETVALTVRDHGQGVPRRIRQRLFKQYYQFDDGQDDRETALDGSRGMGIGLYISARLVREHGGRLEVDDADGGGAIFSVTLPRVAENA
jgi:excisionase family DNA binding protein